jgi:hypothetical protein
MINETTPKIKKTLGEWVAPVENSTLNITYRFSNPSDKILNCLLNRLGCKHFWINRRFYINFIEKLDAENLSLVLFRGI